MMSHLMDTCKPGRIHSFNHPGVEGGSIMAGAKQGESLRDHIKRTLAAKGITEATSVHVDFSNGETVVIVSPDNPALDRPMADVAKVDYKRAAEAGLTAESL